MRLSFLEEVQKVMMRERKKDEAREQQRELWKPERERQKGNRKTGRGIKVQRKEVSQREGVNEREREKERERARARTRERGREPASKESDLILWRCG